MSNKFNKEKKILFVKGFNDNDSKTLSEKYPNAIVFSEPEKHNGIYIKNIYKNGISYNKIQGIDPDNNKFIFNDNTISLDLDNKNGLLNLNKNEIEVKYFYIGLYIGDGSIFEYESIIRFFKDNILDDTGYTDGGNLFKLIKNKLNNLFDNEEDKNSIMFYPAGSNPYLIIPVEWENHLKIYYDNINIGKYIFEIENVEQIQRNIILNDGCKYNVYILPEWNTIKIEKSF